MRTGRRLGAGAVSVAPSLLLIWGLALAAVCFTDSFEAERAAPAEASDGQPLVIILKNPHPPHLLAPQNDSPPPPAPPAGAASSGPRDGSGAAGGSRGHRAINLRQQTPRDPPYANSSAPKRGAFGTGPDHAEPSTISVAGLGSQNVGQQQQESLPQPQRPLPRVVAPRMPQNAIGFGQGNTERLAWTGTGSASRSSSSSGSGLGPGLKAGVAEPERERTQSLSEKRLVTYMRKVYTALMEKEGPGAREDNAVFAITAEPAAIEGEKYFAFNLSFLSAAVAARVEAAELHLFRRRVPRPATQRRDIQMFMYRVSLSQRAPTVRLPLSKAAAAQQSAAARGQGGEGGIPRVSHLPELFLLQIMPLANIRDGWNRLELTSMLQRALQRATNRQAVNYFFAINFKTTSPAGRIYEVDLRNFLMNQLAKPYLILTLRSSRASDERPVSVTQANASNACAPASPTAAAVGSGSIGSEFSQQLLEQTRRSRNELEPEDGYQKDRPNGGSAPEGDRQAPRNPTANPRFNPFVLLESADTAVSSAVIGMLREEIARSQRETGYENDQPLPGAAATSETGADGVQNGCAVRPWRIRILRALSHLIISPLELEINRCSGQCSARSLNQTDLRYSLIYKAFVEENGEPPALDHQQQQTGPTRRGGPGGAMERRRWARSSARGGGEQLSSMCMPDRLEPLELVVAVAQPGSSIARVAVPGLIVRSCKCVFSF